MEWNLTEGDSAPKIKKKVEEKKKVLLCSCFYCVEKNISAHAQSVDSNCMYFSEDINVHCL